MEKAPSFVVPAGVVFEIADDGVTIENRGDVVLHTTFGRTLKSVVSSEGSVELHGDVTAGSVSARGHVTVRGGISASTIEAGGDVQTDGDVAVSTIRAGGSLRVNGDASVRAIHAAGGVLIEGDTSAEAIHANGGVSIGGAFSSGLIRAEEIRLGGPVTSRGLQAIRRIHIGPVRISVDAILAPEVNVEPGTTGRAPIVECQNELGPNALKGKFRLADWEETFGDPGPYLAERGLSIPGEAAPPVDAPAPPPEPHAHGPHVAQPAAAEPPAPEPAAPVEPPAPAEPEAGAAMEVEIEEAEDTAMTSSVPGGTPPEHPLHGELTTAVNKIMDCYGESELPPAVARLHELIEARAYDHVRSEITSIWSDLLKFHQKKGLRIQHQVTTTFNTINSVVKKM